MLAKVNSINEQKNKVNVTLLDVDDLGLVIPVKDLLLHRIRRGYVFFN